MAITPYTTQPSPELVPMNVPNLLALPSSMSRNTKVVSIPMRLAPGQTLPPPLFVSCDLPTDYEKHEKKEPTPTFHICPVCST